MKGEKDNIKESIDQLILKVKNGLHILELKDIMKIESCRGGSQITTIDQETIKTNNPLRYFENLLSEKYFFRIHNKYIVNLNYVMKFISLGRSGYVVLQDSSRIDVAHRKKTLFLTKLREYTK